MSVIKARGAVKRSPLTNGRGGPVPVRVLGHPHRPHRGRAGRPANGRRLASGRRPGAALRHRVIKCSRLTDTASGL